MLKNKHLNIKIKNKHMEIRIQDIQNYIQEIDGDDLVLIPKENYISESDLCNISLKQSFVEQCNIKGKYEIISDGPSLECFRKILIEIWKKMPTQKILQNTTFNFKLQEENGYVWCPDINMYFQYKNTNGTFQELLKMVKINKMTMQIKIKLETERIIYFLI
jgi:hypothetical protein